MGKRNPFTKEYCTGRKDQFDVDYAIFRKTAKEAETKEEFEKLLEERFNYMISRIADDNAKELLEDMQLL